MITATFTSEHINMGTGRAHYTYNADTREVLRVVAAVEEGSGEVEVKVAVGDWSNVVLLLVASEKTSPVESSFPAGLFIGMDQNGDPTDDPEAVTPCTFLSGVTFTPGGNNANPVVHQSRRP